MARDRSRRPLTALRLTWAIWPMRLKNYHNFHDFRRPAQRRLPGPIFNEIDGGADDEVTLRRSTSAFDKVALIPNVLAGVEEIDPSVTVTVMGQKLDLPVCLSPTALQRPFPVRDQACLGDQRCHPREIQPAAVGCPYRHQRR